MTATLRKRTSDEARGGSDRPAMIEVRVRVSREALQRLERIALRVSTIAAVAWRFVTAPWWPWSS